MADFETAIKLVLAHEGGYTPGLPGDAGGETNYGISQGAYPMVDIKHLTKDAATDIYRKDYWNFGYEGLQDQSLANAVFDFGVNAGTATAVRILQLALGIGVDGVFGPETRDSANAQPDAVNKFTALRILHYSGLGNFQTFKASWIKRALDW